MSEQPIMSESDRFKRDKSIHDAERAALEAGLAECKAEFEYDKTVNDRWPTRELLVAWNAAKRARIAAFRALAKLRGEG